MAPLACVATKGLSKEMVSEMKSGEMRNRQQDPGHHVPSKGLRAHGPKEKTEGTGARKLKGRKGRRGTECHQVNKPAQAGRAQWPQT